LLPKSEFSASQDRDLAHALSNAIPITDEYPAETDLRSIIKHLSEWLPVEEIAGLRLFESELRDLGLIHDSESEKNLISLFHGQEYNVTK
jgi:hypothetical protein